MKNTPLALLSLILLSTPLVSTAQQSGDFTYTSDGSAITITGYTGPGGAVTIPDTVAGLPVTTLGDYAFLNQPGLTSVTIPSSITNLGDAVFDFCSNLTSVTIPNGVTGIGTYMFSSCSSLTNVTIPASVTYVGSYAFQSCTSLTNITIPGTVTNIGAFAFAICTGLTNVTIPSTVTDLGDSAFAYCTNLAGIALFNGVTNIGIQAFYYCKSLVRITIPGSLTSIGGSAFTGCASLTQIFFAGNAPVGVQDIFYFRPGTDHVPANIYYLPGTTGWSAMIAGHPAVLWNPQMQFTSIGLAGFGCNITGTADIPIVIEACTNPANAYWAPLQSLNLTNGTFDFSDPNWTNYPARFYRIRSP
jgi:hypothetical protein